MTALHLSGSGDPNGVVFGNPGDVYQDTTGSLWLKQSGSNTNTAWTQVSIGAFPVDATVHAANFNLAPGFLARVDSTAGNVIAQLPSIATLAPRGTIIGVKITAGTNIVTAVANGADKIDVTSASYQLGNAPGYGVILVSDGVGNWIVAGRIMQTLDGGVSYAAPDNGQILIGSACGMYNGGFTCPGGQLNLNPNGSLLVSRFSIGPTAIQIFGQLVINGFITPAAIGGGTTQNYNPAGLQQANQIYQDLSANHALGGLVQPNSGAPGMRVTIWNESSTFNLTLNHNDVGSNGVNRFFLPGSANLVVAPLGSVTLVYSPNSNWRVEQ